jgi:2-dehydropantoate 2-reductase
MGVIRTVYIIGAGALGAVYAGLLYERDKECVAFIAAGERGERLRRSGVIVNGRHYPIPVLDPEEIDTPADLVIVAVYTLPPSGPTVTPLPSPPPTPEPGT